MIYLDNSATTNPKPNPVLASVGYAMKNFSYNSGRGGYRQSVLTAEKIYDVREKIGGLIYSFYSELYTGTEYGDKGQCEKRRSYNYFLYGA